MGKKYIIEMKEGERLYKTKLNALNEPVIREITCEPYTEPDMEQVRKEACQKGLEDAWDAARKIVTMPNRDFINSDILDLDPGESIFTKYTAAEAIEKIRQYEQEKDGLRQNIQTIVDQCGYTLDEIAEVLQKMREDAPT